MSLRGKYHRIQHTNMKRLWMFKTWRSCCRNKKLHSQNFWRRNRLRRDFMTSFSMLLECLIMKKESHVNNSFWEWLNTWDRLVSTETHLSWWFNTVVRNIHKHSPGLAVFTRMSILSTKKCISTQLRSKMGFWKILILIIMIHLWILRLWSLLCITYLCLRISYQISESSMKHSMFWDKL